MLQRGERSSICSIRVEDGRGALETKTVLARQSRRARRANPGGARAEEIDRQVENLVIARLRLGVCERERRVLPLARGEQLRRADEGVSARDSRARATIQSGPHRIVSCNGPLGAGVDRADDNHCGGVGEKSHWQIYAAIRK